MKKYSSYFYTMMVLASICILGGYALVTEVAYGAAAVLFTIGFILWFAGAMAPHNEKYRS